VRQEREVVGPGSCLQPDIKNRVRLHNKNEKLESLCLGQGCSSVVEHLLNEMNPQHCTKTKREGERKRGREGERRRRRKRRREEDNPKVHVVVCFIAHGIQ
jgi:hypothetical protein